MITREQSEKEYNAWLAEQAEKRDWRPEDENLAPEEDEEGEDE